VAAHSGGPRAGAMRGGAVGHLGEPTAQANVSHFR